MNLEGCGKEESGPNWGTVLESSWRDSGSSQNVSICIVGVPACIETDASKIQVGRVTTWASLLCQVLLWYMVAPMNTVLSQLNHFHYLVLRCHLPHRVLFSCEYYIYCLLYPIVPLSCAFKVTQIMFVLSFHSTLQALDGSVQTVFHHAHEQSVMAHTAVWSQTVAAVGHTQCAGQQAVLSGEWVLVLCTDAVSWIETVMSTLPCFFQPRIRPMLNWLSRLIPVHWWGWWRRMGRLWTLPDTRRACNSRGKLQWWCHVAWDHVTVAACPQVLPQPDAD